MERCPSLYERKGGGPRHRHPDPLKYLEELGSPNTARRICPNARFCGGAVGFAGYDTIRYVERLPNAPPDDRQRPRSLLRLLRSHWSYSTTSAKTIAVVANAHLTEEKEASFAYTAACRGRTILSERLQTGAVDLSLSDIDVSRAAIVRPEDPDSGCSLPVELSRPMASRQLLPRPSATSMLVISSRWC